MALTPGTRLGPYEVTAQIGVGGMGEVYQATDTNLKRAVAIKVLPASVAADAERLARFQREAEVLASLNHPHIAAIYGLERSGGITALVMELVEGPTLADRVAQGSIPIDEALPIARQIVEALEAAHEQGIIHRDLKPANIKLRPDGTVKVLDFGLAKAMEPAAGSSPNMSMSPTITTPAMTQAGMILGTAAYMSPEQARGKPVDKRADIWAFGCVLYEMLTGRQLFTGETVSDTLASVLKTDPKWSALPSATPTAVRRLLRRCLEKDPKLRLQAIGEGRILLSEPFEEDRAGVTASSRSRFGPVPWALAGTFLLTTLVTSFLHFREAPLVPQSIRFQVGAPENSVIWQFRLSPDGRHLAFAAYAAGQSRLWVRSLDSLNATLLAGTDGATYPFWSPDSTRIGFFAQGKLKTIAAAGGLAVSLCDVVNGRGGTWSRDGVILFAPNIVSGLYRVAETGGAPVPVTTTVAGPVGGDRFPEFLPDGTRFVFLRTSEKDGGLYGGSLSGAAVARILPDASNALYVPGEGPEGFLLFRRDNTLMAQPFDPGRLETTGGVIPLAEQVSVAFNAGYGAFAASPDGTLAYISGIPSGGRQLVWLDRSGKRLSVASKPDEISGPALSPDGSMVAFSVGNSAAGAADLWLLRLATGFLSKLTFGPATTSSPVWSPDGSRLVFTASERSSYQIQQLRVTGAGQPEAILQGPYNTIGVSDWSTNGRLIVFSNRSEKTKDDLWLLPTEGDRKAIPFLESLSNEINGRFSPDGQWMAYQSDESGRYETYVQHVPPDGSKFQISSAGGVSPRWSRDGTELFYLESGQRLMRVPVKLGASFERGQGQLLFEDIRFLDESPLPSTDGQRFLALLRTDEDSQTAAITVVTNWQTTLKR